MTRKFTSSIQLLVAIALLGATARLAMASTAGCFRDIRKDTKNTPSPLDDVIHDFGCPPILCDELQGACQPGLGSYGGHPVYFCMCDGGDPPPCVMGYWDTADNGGSGGGSGGSVVCGTMLCAHPCQGEDTWIDIGDPEVPQHANNCQCPP